MGRESIAHMNHRGLILSVTPSFGGRLRGVRVVRSVGNLENGRVGICPMGGVSGGACMTECHMLWYCWRVMVARIS